MNVTFLDMPPQARLWVYAANRVLKTNEQQEIKAAAQQFINNWTAHQKELKAAFDIYEGIFLIIAVDEHFNEVSGCGIDKLVHFMQEIDKLYNLNLFNRLQIEMQLPDGTIQLTNKQQLSVIWQNNQVNKHTLFFNKMVTNKADFDTHFKQPLSKSWVFQSIKTALAE
jgi:hypothetical protein